jgi:hypothetical protein
MKLQETLYRREGHKEYREGYANIDWDKHLEGHSESMQDVEAAIYKSAFADFLENLEPIPVTEDHMEIISCSNCEHYDNCNTFGKAGDRADKCGTYTKRGE